jgi:uncharacterized protein YndB with AHSA1/START domain
MTAKTNDVVRKELTINASQRRTFQVFTEQMDLWWPRMHHIGKSAMKEAVLETKPGGRWYEVGVDGTECNWGKVLVWNPPRQLVLAWQITAEWQYDPNFLTEVEVNFIEQGPNLTSVTLEHRNIEKFGAQAQEIWSAFDSDGGWTGLLKSFAAIAETGAQESSA